MGASVFAPGVIGQIVDGERPARVPDNVIDELKGRPDAIAHMYDLSDEALCDRWIENPSYQA